MPLVASIRQPADGLRVMSAACPPQPVGRNLGPYSTVTTPPRSLTLGGAPSKRARYGSGSDGSVPRVTLVARTSRSRRAEAGPSGNPGWAIAGSSAMGPPRVPLRCSHPW